MRKIAELSENEYGYKIFKDTEFDEYTVKFYFKGVHIRGADYFTDDEKDAIKTAVRQMMDIMSKNIKRGA